MKTKSENPSGLHQKYVIRKIVGFKNAGKGMQGDFITKAVDRDSEYFVLRLDDGSKDKKHLEACRIGIHAYAKAIESHIPELAKDLIERYPLSSPEKQEAKQLHEVKDWDEVVNRFVDEDKGNHYSVSDFIHWLKQNYLLPSEQTPLKELSEISDEDAIEMAKIFAGIEGEVTINRPANNLELDQSDVHFVVQVHQGKDKTFKSFCTPKYITENYPVNFYQYLQSKGYKLPVYFSPQQNNVSDEDIEDEAYENKVR